MVAVRRTLARKIYYGWVITLTCFIATVAVFGSSYTFSVFYEPFLDSFDASRSEIALVFGAQTVLLYVVGVGMARLIEYRGQRLVIALSSAVLVVGLVWAAFARSYLELFLSLGVVSAVGLAGLYIVGWATLPQWFERRRGTATSVAASGTGVGLVVFPTVAEAVLAAHGWRTAMLALAGSMAVLLLLVVALFADSPAEVGADPRIEFGEGARGADEGEDHRGVRDVVVSTPFVLVFAGWLLIYVPFYVVLSHVVLHAVDVGVGRATGVLALTVLGLLTTVTRAGIGPLADRGGRVRTFLVCSVFLGGATVALAASATTRSVLAAAAAIGVGYGGAGGLLGAVTADLFGNRSVTTLFALLSLSFGFAGLVAPPLAGAWFEAAGSYEVAFAVSGLAGVAGTGCTALGARLSSRASVRTGR